MLGAGVIAAGGGETRLLAQPRASAALSVFGQQMRSLPGIARAKICSPDGFIRYSTDAN